MNTNYTMIVRSMILHFCFNNRIKYDHNHAVISQRDSTMGKPLWNTTSGVPQWLAHDGVPQWYSTTGASENVTPVTETGIHGTTVTRGQSLVMSCTWLCLLSVGNALSTAYLFCYVGTLLF